MQHFARRHWIWKEPLRGGVIVLAAVWVCLGPQARASDLKPEKAWSDLLEGHIRHGQAVWLTPAGGPKVLGIFEQARTPAPRGGIILLHDMGEHPDWPQVIAPLRKALPRRGWTTLSVQMPLLAGDAGPAQYAPLVPEAAPRIKAAVAYLAGRHVSPIIIAGYGLGATMGAAYLAGQKASPVQGFIGISTGTMAGAPAPLDLASYLSKLGMPVLVLYGSRDYEWVVQSVSSLAAQGRRAAAAATPDGTDNGPPPFRQVEITGADHGYTGVTDILTEDVLGWADRVAKGRGNGP